MGKLSEFKTRFHREMHSELGVIDKNGYLHTERHGVLKKQICHKEDDKYCGDWCMKLGAGGGLGINGEEIKPRIKLCEARVLSFNEFVDMREPVEDILQRMESK